MTELWPTISTTSLSAAKRQMDAAIRCLLTREDPLAVHTLAYASYGLLRVISKTQGAGAVRSQLEADARRFPEKKFWKRFSELASALKHGERNVVDVPEEFNEKPDDGFPAPGVAHRDQAAVGRRLVRVEPVVVARPAHRRGAGEACGPCLSPAHGVCEHHLVLGRSGTGIGVGLSPTGRLHWLKRRTVSICYRPCLTPPKAPRNAPAVRPVDVKSKMPPASSPPAP